MGRRWAAPPLLPPLTTTTPKNGRKKNGKKKKKTSSEGVVLPCWSCNPSHLKLKKKRHFTAATRCPAVKNNKGSSVFASCWLSTAILCQSLIPVFWPSKGTPRLACNLRWRPRMWMSCLFVSGAQTVRLRLSRPQLREKRVSGQTDGRFILVSQWHWRNNPGVDLLLVRGGNWLVEPTQLWRPQLSAGIAADPEENVSYWRPKESVSD